MLFEEIEKLNSELNFLSKKLSKRQQELKKLKIGQKIYTQEGGGYLDIDEFYPVIVLEIDHERGKVLIHEKSLEFGDTVWSAENVKRYIETFITKI